MVRRGSGGVLAPAVTGGPRWRARWRHDGARCLGVAVFGYLHSPFRISIGKIGSHNKDGAHVTHGAMGSSPTGAGVADLLHAQGRRPFRSGCAVQAGRGRRPDRRASAGWPRRAGSDVRPPGTACRSAAGAGRVGDMAPQRCGPGCPAERDSRCRRPGSPGACPGRLDSGPSCLCLEDSGCLADRDRTRPPWVGRRREGVGGVAAKPRRGVGGDSRNAAGRLVPGRAAGRPDQLRPRARLPGRQCLW